METAQVQRPRKTRLEYLREQQDRLCKLIAKEQARAEEKELKMWVLMTDTNKWVRRIPSDDDLLNKVCAKWNKEKECPIFLNENLLPDKLPTHFKTPYNTYLKSLGYVYSTQERFTFVKPGIETV
jgi:hypothetical protein